MPHIFLQLGMWPEAAASNESAWEASDAWMKRKNLSVNVRDYHSLHWLLYCYLQQGRYRKAEELLNLMKQVMSESSYDNKLRPGYYENNYANMAAAFVVETERWELAAKLFPATKANDDFISEPAMGSHGSHNRVGGIDTRPAAAAPPYGATSGSMTVRSSTASQTLPLFIRGLASAVNDSSGLNTGLASLPSELGSIELEIAAPQPPQ